MKLIGFLDLCMYCVQWMSGGLPVCSIPELKVGLQEDKGGAKMGGTF